MGRGCIGGEERAEEEGKIKGKGIGRKEGELEEG
jgi:hypothetical protein